MVCCAGKQYVPLAVGAGTKPAGHGGGIRPSTRASVCVTVWATARDDAATQRSNRPRSFMAIRPPFGPQACSSGYQLSSPRIASGSVCPRVESRGGFCRNSNASRRDCDTATSSISCNCLRKRFATTVLSSLSGRIAVGRCGQAPHSTRSGP